MKNPPKLVTSDTENGKDVNLASLKKYHRNNLIISFKNFILLKNLYILFFYYGDFYVNIDYNYT
jgi:hypothetical protein